MAALFMGACQGEESKEEVVYNLVQAEILPDLLEIEVNLDEYSDADPITLEWTDAEYDGYGVVTYDMAFVREGGDFTRPVAVFHATSLVDSLRTKRTFTKAELKEVYANASLTTKDSEVTVEWIVRTAGGGKKLQSESVGKIAMTMTPDPDPFRAGDDVYIGGAGAVESGRKFIYMPNINYLFDAAAHYNDNAPRCTTFDYEIFTKLTAGQPIYFKAGSADESETDWYFDMSGTSAEEAITVTRTLKKDATLAATVAADGLYRIRFNSVNGDFYLKKIDRATFRYWKLNANGGVNTSNVTTNLTYERDGNWTLPSVAIPAEVAGYKFIFYGLDSDQPYGAQYVDTFTMSIPTIAEASDSYWQVVPVRGGAPTKLDVDRGNGTWRFPDEVKGKNISVTIRMNDEAGAYTHSIDIVE